MRGQMHTLIVRVVTNTGDEKFVTLTITMSPKAREYYENEIFKIVKAVKVTVNPENFSEWLNRIEALPSWKEILQEFKEFCLTKFAISHPEQCVLSGINVTKEKNKSVEDDIKQTFETSETLADFLSHLKKSKKYSDIEIVTIHDSEIMFETLKNMFAEFKFKQGSGDLFD
jgi:hypothetical protein